MPRRLAALCLYLFLQQLLLFQARALQVHSAGVNNTTPSTRNATTSSGPSGSASGSGLAEKKSRTCDGVSDKTDICDWCQSLVMAFSDACDPVLGCNEPKILNTNVCDRYMDPKTRGDNWQFTPQWTKCKELTDEITDPEFGGSMRAFIIEKILDFRQVRDRMESSSQTRALESPNVYHIERNVCKLMACCSISDYDYESNDV